VIKNGGVVERQLSGTSIESIKQAISDNRFFELQGFYPPKDGVADYFSHSLTVLWTAEPTRYRRLTSGLWQSLSQKALA
jgi:hypothetical protein